MLNNFWTIFDTPGLTENSTPQQHQKKLFPRLLPGLQDRLRQASWKQPARSELQDQHEQKDAGHVGLHLKLGLEIICWSVMRLLKYGLQDWLRQASWKQPALASSERTSGQT